MEARALQTDWEQQRRAMRHELRTQVNHILSYAELLLYDAEAAGQAEFAEDLRTVQEDGREGLATIDRILDAVPLGETAVKGAVGKVETLMQSVRSTVWKLEGYDYAADDEQITADLERIAASAQRLVAQVRRAVLTS